MASYDVIGDVHGCADALERLLRQMGYVERDGAWRHPGRTAVFVGDLIDRGPQQVETVTLVRRMVDAGTALITMGNHEFNAVAWATPDGSRPGMFLRRRDGDKGRRHREQHAEFLAQVGEDSALHREFVEWFRTLPMHLDLGALRVVHACWHDESIEVLRAAERSGRLTDEFLHAAHDRGHLCPTAAEEGRADATAHGDGNCCCRASSPEYRAIETVLKGPEMPVSPSYLDKGGHVRSRARVRWWDVSATTVRTLAEIPPCTKTPSGRRYPTLPDAPSSEAEPFRYLGEVPVVFGHYWRTKRNPVVEPSAVCVDLSAVRGGHMAAYRFDGEPTIDPGRVVAVRGLSRWSR
jgi:hypothetical protein